MHDPQCQQLKTFEDGACKYLISGSKGIMDRLLSGSCIWIETMSRIKERLLTEPCCAAAVICQSNLWIAPLNMAWMVIWYVSGSITHFISRCFCENLLLTTVLKSDNRPMRLTLLGKYTSFFSFSLQVVSSMLFYVKLPTFAEVSSAKCHWPKWPQPNWVLIIEILTMFDDIVPKTTNNNRLM